MCKKYNNEIPDNNNEMFLITRNKTSNSDAEISIRIIVNEIYVADVFLMSYICYCWWLLLPLIIKRSIENVYVCNGQIYTTVSIEKGCEHLKE